MSDFTHNMLQVPTFGVAKVVHSPLDKENRPATPHSQWSPVRRKKPLNLEEACIQCTKKVKGAIFSRSCPFLAQDSPRHLQTSHAILLLCFLPPGYQLCNHLHSTSKFFVLSCESWFLTRPCGAWWAIIKIILPSWWSHPSTAPNTCTPVRDSHRGQV